MTETPFPIARDRLAELFLFRDIEPGCLDRLLTELRIRNLVPGEILFTPGEHNDSLYLIIEGSLEIRLENPDGAPIMRLEFGESVGETSVLDRLETSTFISAHDACRLAVFDQLTLWTLINDCEGFARNLLHMISRRVSSIDQGGSTTRLRHRQWEHHAITDAMTGLHNRRWLDMIFGRQIERSRRANDPFSLIMLDLDNFSRYNDQHGRMAGDCALMAVAKVLYEHVRPTDQVVRYAAKSFVFCSHIPILRAHSRSPNGCAPPSPGSRFGQKGQPSYRISPLHLE